MADKKLNEVTKVTDMAYVPVIMADGSVGQIAKADLASVVAGQMPRDKAFIMDAKHDLLTDANDAVLGTMYFQTNAASNMPSISESYLYTIGSSSWRIQFCANDYELYFRRYNPLHSLWASWVKLT